MLKVLKNVYNVSDILQPDLDRKYLYITCPGEKLMTMIDPIMFGKWVIKMLVMTVLKNN